jgi:hypothetical protein
MSSEWLKVMLEEIARKKAERARLLAELAGSPAPPAAAAAPGSAPAGEPKPSLEPGIAAPGAGDE